jgi:hypothetical protein
MHSGPRAVSCTGLSPYLGSQPPVPNTRLPPPPPPSHLIDCEELNIAEDIQKRVHAPITPAGCLLSPSPEAAVVGGNVLTSQRVTDVVLRAFEAAAASQGCMNNLTFGDERMGYYETIAGGAGAGPGWHGRSGVHTHMTNTRITDPEILERRYPVVLRQFRLRTGAHRPRRLPPAGPLRCCLCLCALVHVWVCGCRWGRGGWGVGGTHKQATDARGERRSARAARKLLKSCHSPLLPLPYAHAHHPRARPACTHAGSGGAGRFRGGDGVVRELEFLRPLTVSILSERRATRPFGILGEWGEGRAWMCACMRAWV